MGKRYEDLSRRALIKLGGDFDSENDAALLQYLTENGDKYEGVRPVEKVIARVDQVKDALCGSSSSIKQVINKEADKVLDTVIDALSTAAFEAETALECLKSDGE